MNTPVPPSLSEFNSSLETKSTTPADLDGQGIPSVETSEYTLRAKSNSLSTSSCDEHDTVVSIRLVVEDDYDRGFPAILEQLTELGDVTREGFLNTLQRIRATQNNTDLGASIRLFVAHDIKEDRIVAASTLLIEDKFIHRCGKVGHVEDVVVDKAYRGKNLGTRMMERLIAEAKAAGCYKVILDCSESNAKFYETVGYQRKSVGMAMYFP